MQHHGKIISPEFILQLILDLQRQYHMSQDDAATLTDREHRKIERKLNGKNGVAITDPERMLAASCHRCAAFRQDDPEEKIKARLKAGEWSAWKEMYLPARRNPLIHLLLNKGCTNEAFAQDIYQDALVVLNEHLQRKDFHMDTSLHSYLTRIVLNMWLKYLRDKGAPMRWEDYLKLPPTGHDEDEQDHEPGWDDSPDSSPASPSQGQPSITVELEELILVKLNEMESPKNRIFIKVKYLLGLDHAQIAKPLNITLVRSRQILHRAMSQLKAAVLRDPRLLIILNA